MSSSSFSFFSLLAHRFLTSHNPLYHSHPNTIPNPKPNPRSPLLRWLSSLTHTLPLRRFLLTFIKPSIATSSYRYASPLTQAPPSFPPPLPSFLLHRLFPLIPFDPWPPCPLYHQSSALSHALLLFGSDNEEVLDSVCRDSRDVNAFVDMMDSVSGDGSRIRGATIQSGDDLVFPSSNISLFL